MSRQAAIWVDMGCFRRTGPDEELDNSLSLRHGGSSGGGSGSSEMCNVVCMGALLCDVVVSVVFE